MKRMQALTRKVGCGLSAVALAGLALSPCTALAGPSPDQASAPSEKVETVNVTTAADGTVRDVEVDTTLRNDDGAARLADRTSLRGIEADDDVEFSQSGADLLWDADGDSVSYKGKADADLPIAITVTYRMNGTQVPASEIAGKSGRVTIRYDYENQTSHQAQVNGTTAELVTPFTCVTAMMLDGETFSDVTVTNGKVIEDGDDVVVAGYAMPGLKASLGGLAEDANIPDYFEVSADVVDFELKSTMTIVTAGLMADLDVEGLGFGDADESAGALEEAMSSILEGSNALADGMGELADGANLLSAGAADLASGSQGLVAGLYQLAYGDDGQGGLAAAADGSAALSDGAAQATAAAQALADGEQGIPATAAALQGAAAAGPDAAALAALMADPAYAELSDESKRTIELLVGQSQAVSATAPILAMQAEGITSLAGKMPALSEGLSSLASGLAGASGAAAQLHAGAGGLAQGAGQLSDATSQLSSGMSGAADGSKALNDGLATFNQEGVKSLTSFLTDDFGGFKGRLSALSEASRSYDNFGGKAEGTRGSVKFVFETDAVTAE